MGWIKDIYDIGSKYFPKQVSLKVSMVRDRSTYYIHYENTSERKIDIEDILVNDIEINKYQNVKGMNIKTSFPLQKDQEKTITIYSNMDKNPPHKVTFIVKSRLDERKELEYHL